MPDKVLHKEILTTEQVALMPLVKAFAKEFYLVGGTVIALHLGHRESIDFDLFTDREFDNGEVRAVIARGRLNVDRVLRDEAGQYTLMIRGVHFTFFHYPYRIPCARKLPGVIKMPDLLTLAAMKAFALGRRAKWKDYIDLYFIIKGHHTVEEISSRAMVIYGHEFNQRIFREQLAFHKDINYTEGVSFKRGFAVKEEIIRKALIEFSLQSR